MYCCCSIKEPGLYDYVIFNDDLEDAFAQLVLVAKRALSGKTGNGSQSITGPVTLVAEEEPSKSAEASAAAAAPVAGASPQARRLEHTCMAPGCHLDPILWHYALQPPAERWAYLHLTTKRCFDMSEQWCTARVEGRRQSLDRRSKNSPVRCGGAHNFREAKVTEGCCTAGGRRAVREDAPADRVGAGRCAQQGRGSQRDQPGSPGGRPGGHRHLQRGHRAAHLHRGASLLRPAAWHAKVSAEDHVLPHAAHMQI